MLVLCPFCLWDSLWDFESLGGSHPGVYSCPIVNAGSVVWAWQDESGAAELMARWAIRPGDWNPERYL